MDVHQVTGEKQEPHHVESVHDLLGIGVGVTDIDKMKDHHQDDEDAFHDVDVGNSFPLTRLRSLAACLFHL